VDAQCTGKAVALLERAGAPSGQLGLFRNNILRAASCSSAFLFHEVGESVDPRLLKNNDFDPAGSPVLYVDEGAASLTEIDMVNGLADVDVGGNLAVDPHFVDYPDDVHLDFGSMCVDTGTLGAVPTADFEGDLRDDGSPDIGPDER
jgi:hypothetical protein